MTFGTKLKNLRIDRGLSQPELADQIGIEQSYLSKLENDKSLPSGDILKAALRSFEMTLDDLLHDPLVKTDLGRLKQIPEVALWLEKRGQKSATQQRFLLYVSSLLIAVSITLFYAGFSKLVFPSTFYQYSSQGVVLEGEPMNIFDRWIDLIPPEEFNNDVRRQKAFEINSRKDKALMLSEVNRGTQFEVDVKDGKRLYVYEKEVRQARPENAVLQISGVFLFVLGLMGFFLERRLSR